MLNKNKFKILLLTIFLCSISVYSQSYYWYKNEKTYILMDSTKLNVTTTIEADLSALLKEVDAITEIKQLEKTQNNTLLYSIKLSSFKMYNNTVDYLKSIKDVVCVSPYYGDSSNSVGTSSFFCIQLYKEDDYDLLYNFALQNNLKIIEQVPYMPTWYMLSITNNKINSIEASNIAFESGLFANIDPLFIFEVSRQCPPNDIDFHRQWGLQNTTHQGIDIDVCNAWSISTGAGIKVAVLDTGIDTLHNDLRDNMIPSLNYNTHSGGRSIFLPGISYVHATFVAGIIAAKRNNNFKIAGVAPNAKLISISDTSRINSLNAPVSLATGISWAWKVANVDVINNSWALLPASYSYFGTAILESAIDSALRFGRGGKGCVVVFASGNRNCNVVDYPGRCNDDIIVVGGISKNGIKWYDPLVNTPCYGNGSNYGTHLDIVAPCVEIYSTYSNDSAGFGYVPGTSWAAPHVSGVAALILEKNPHLTQKQVKEIIELTAKKLPNYTYNYNDPARPNGGWNDQVGYGLVNAYEALLKVDCYVTGVQPPAGQNYKKIECNIIKVKDATVPTGKTLELEATESVIIESGFTVESGAAFIIE